MARCPLVSVALALLCAFSACSSPAPRSRAERPAEGPIHELTPAERIELARRVHQRGRGHERLDVLEGEWRVEVTSQLADGSARVTEGRGRARIQWVLGRRFLDWDLELDVSGSVHRVRGYLGYDVVLQEYQALWISELTTGMSLARGDGDPEGRGLVLQVRSSGAEAVGPRSVLRVLDRDHFVIESVAADARGEEGVVQAASYVRDGGA